MKMRVYLVILLYVFAACLPANGEILIYNLAKSEGRTFLKADLYYDSGEDGGIGRGYLILDIDLVRDYSIDNAVIISYSDGESPSYYSCTHDFQFQLFLSNSEWTTGSRWWVLSDINTPKEGEIVSMILSGRPGMRNIGLPTKKPAPKKFEGTYMVSVTFSVDNIDYVYKLTEFLSFRLNTRLTKEANRYWSDYEQAEGAGFDYTPFEWAVGGVDEENNVYGMIKADLESSGYQQLDPNEVIDPWLL